jgi:GTPase SAR1 family protein
MRDTIKITMLGNSRAGKTAYLAGMFGYMSASIAIEDTNDFFSITYGEKFKDKYSELMQMWEMLINNGLVPAPTGSEETFIIPYSFTFNYNSEPLVNFDWIDYRGGALNQLGTSDDEELLETVVESDCIILCVSAENLTKPIVKEDGKVNMNSLLKLNTASGIPLERINTFLNKVEQNNRNSKSNIPIVIMITKYDLLMDSSNISYIESSQPRNVREKDEIIRDIQYLFKPLFRSNSKWSVFVCPFTLGPNIIIDNNGRTDVVKGDIEPLHAEYPIAFAIYSYLQKEISNSDKQIANTSDARDKEIARLKTKQSNLQTKQANLNDFNKKNFFQKAFSDEDAKTLGSAISVVQSEIYALTSSSESALAEINRARSEREKINKKLKSVASIIEETDIFVGGSKQKIKMN